MVYTVGDGWRSSCCVVSSSNTRFGSCDTPRLGSMCVSVTIPYHTLLCFLVILVFDRIKCHLDKLRAVKTLCDTYPEALKVKTRSVILTWDLPSFSSRVLGMILKNRCIDAQCSGIMNQLYLS